MSKFDYKANGELNSQYLLDLLNEYLNKILQANDTKGIVENDYKINTKSNRFARWFNNATNRIAIKFKRSANLDNYNKTLTTKYVNEVQDKLEIFLKTNVLSAKQFFDLTQTLKAIKFDIVLPELEANRNKVIKQSENRFLRALRDVKYLANGSTEHILFNPPVDDIKPFLSDKVSAHTININELQKLINKFVEMHHTELLENNFEQYEVEFVTSEKDFYSSNIIDNGIGDDVENFIRETMQKKLEILAEDDTLVEEKEIKIREIDLLLKRLKISKIEQMIRRLIQLQTNEAQAKEVIDKCKEVINSTTITGKSSIFLVMDNLYYKLSKRCEALTATIKSKLQQVDKQKLFAMLEEIQSNTSKTNTGRKAKPIASDLYDDDEPNEIHISEDIDDEAEDEVVIDE